MRSLEGKCAECGNVTCLDESTHHRQLLGPERFKLINQAARDALEVGGFLPDKEDEGTSGAGTGKDKNRRGRR